MQKRARISLCSILLIASFLIITFATPLINVSAATDKPTVEFNNPAIPADVGETVTLSDYAVEFSASNIIGADKINWSSEEITITNGTVKPSAKGIYKLTATSETYIKNVYLLVKAPHETEYVLFEDDFNTNSLSKYSVYGNCSIADGKLVLNSKSGTDAYVTIPGFLSEFGNYSLSSSVKLTEANNAERWVSMMYRINGLGYPFFQMAVRQNASLANGVELAHNLSGSWGYHFKGSYTSALSSSEFYTLGLNVYDNKAAAFINGMLCGSSESVTQIDRGTIGLRSNGCIAYFDNIKITARFNTKGMPADLADIRVSESGITLAPSMIYEINSKSDLDGILTNSPAIAIMNINKDGNVLSSSGNVICHISDALIALKSKVIPAIKPDSSCNESTLSSLISSLMLKDILLVTDSAALIKAVRSSQSNVLGVYDLSNNDLSKLTATEIRKDTLSSGAKICMLPASMASQTTTEILNTLGVTVWYKAAQNSKTELFALVTSGANGILTTNRDLFESVVTSPIFKTNSIIRPVGIIGHRGTPALAPENTIAGSLLAAANGANIIENDIYITTDGVIVVMHDETIDRTTNGSGKVESFSYDQLCKYYVDCAPTTSETQYGRVTDSQPIPTLEDYFQAFKDTDTFMFIEIKSSKPEAIATALATLIDKYDIADQCGVITFKQAALTAIRAAIPEISVGYLCSDSTLNDITTNTSKFESSYNPDSSKINAELVKDLAARGIFTWPWTIRDSANFDKFFLMGVGGITTDNSYLAKNYVKRISTESKKYDLEAGKSLDLKLLAETYGGIDVSDLSNATYLTSDAEMLVIEGNQTLRYSSGKLTASAQGDATVLFRLSFKLNNGQTAFVYSEPVAVSVTSTVPSGDSTQESTPTPDTNIPTPTTPDNTAENSEEDSGCGSTLSTLSIAAITLGLGFTFKKKKD